MPSHNPFWRNLGFLPGLFLLWGSPLVAGLLFLAGNYLPPLLLLLVFPLGGLLGGLWLILTRKASLWDKLLVLVSPVLGILLYCWVASWSLPAQDHLIFLIPANFRGQVVLVQRERGAAPLPRVNGATTLTVPATGVLATSEALDKRWLATADYYLLQPGDRPRRPLRQLEELAGYINFERRAPDENLNKREIGIFESGLAYKKIPFAQSYPDAPGGSSTSEIPYLTFIVACYDSLATKRVRRQPVF